MDMGYWMWNGYWVIEPPRRSFPDLWPCPLFGAFAHRAWNPPTSSSLADEKRVCSLLLSTAARDSRRSRPRVSDGTRTRDILDHNQVLYQLSYTHHASGPIMLSGPHFAA